MLLGQVGSIRQRDLNDARLDAIQFRADQSHDRLFGEALFDLFSERVGFEVDEVMNYEMARQSARALRWRPCSFARFIALPRKRAA